ncbi:MAG TPA: hypothetical protein VHS99_12715 [Chloroflexota bacterium]|nr:hypothetical protein [Chloroflexota bacterium]
MIAAHAAAATSARPAWWVVLARRWPTLLALVMGGLTWGAGPMKGLSEGLLVFGFGYLAVTVVGRRRVTWVIFCALLASVVLLRLQDVVDPALVLIGTAVGLVAWGAVRGSAQAVTGRCRLISQAVATKRMPSSATFTPPSNT